MRLRFVIFALLLSGMLVLSTSNIKAATNMVTNPDFAVDTTGWTIGADYGTLAIDKSVIGIVGNTMMAKVDKVGVNAWEPEIHSPAFNLTNGKTYTYAFWAKTEAGKTRVLGCSFEQMETYVGMGESITINDKWTDYHYTGVWTNPSSPPQVVIHIGMNNAPSPLLDVWFSDFRVYEGDYVEENLASVSPVDRLATAWGQIKGK